MSSSRNALLPLSWFVLTCCVTLAAAGQLDHSVRVRVTDEARPLASALRQVEEQLGVVATYEDTCYLDPSEITDKTRELSRTSVPERRILVMRGGSFSFEQRDSSKATPAAVFEALLQKWARDGYRSKFDVQKAEGGYHIVPTAAIDELGSIAPCVSPLDAVVSLEPKEESPQETLFRLVDAVSRASGRRVGVSVRGVPKTRSVTLFGGATSEVARDVLWQVLRDLGDSYSWQLLCSVGRDRECGLNIHRVVSR